MNINRLLQRIVLPTLVLFAMVATGTCQDQTPLSLAVIKNDLPLVKQLLAQGAEINETNKFGFTPLMLAALRENRNAVVDTLLAEGADTNIRGVEGSTVLYWASMYSGPGVLKALIKAKAKVDIKTDDGLTPIMGAALWGKLENVQILQSAGAVFTNDLVYSSALGQLDIVKKLVTDGANVNAKNESRRTPLAAAAANGNLSVVNFLLVQGADVNSESTDGNLTRSALSSAAEKGHLEVVKALLNKKASLKPDSAHETPLFTSVVGGHLEVVKCLLDNGADPNGQNPDGEPVLFTAAQKNAEAAQALLDAGADVNATNVLGSTALIVASYFGNADSVLLLLSKGARVSAKTGQGQTALQIAQGLRDREQIVDMLSNPDAAVKHMASFKATKPKTPIDSKTMTKTAWREKIRPYWNPGGGIKVVTIADFKALFGEPAKTQSVEGLAYWYYDCSDGTIQMVLIDPNMSGGRMLINAVNDF